MLDHCNQWAQNPNDVASTKIGLPNQAWTWGHATKTYGFESS